MEAYREQYHEHFILLTFFSPSGFEIRKNYPGADLVLYMPFDTARNARDFIALSTPAIAFFVKYEFWYNYLRFLRDKNVPALSVSTILRGDQIATRWYGGIQRKSLRLISHFFTQNEETIEVLRGLGIPSATLAGDTRFDRVWAIAKAQEPNAAAASFTEGANTLIAGSVWPQDLAVLLPAWEKTKKLKLILAPHEIIEEEIVQLCERYEGKAIRITEVAERQDLSAYALLIVDTIGQLSSLYRYADMAWIGGAYGKGLHNILEAATFGMPICFGNRNYRKFAEANDLLDIGAAHLIGTSEELQSILLARLSDEVLRKTEGERAARYVEEKRGATARIMQGINTWL